MSSPHTSHCSDFQNYFMSQCFPSLEVTQTRQQTRGRQILGILGGCARLLELGDRNLLWREYLNSVLRVVHLFWLGNPALSTLGYLLPL